MLPLQEEDFQTIQPDSRLISKPSENIEVTRGPGYAEKVSVYDQPQDPSIVSPHWEKRITKTIFTLNIDNYAPRIRMLTLPLLKRWAQKIQADIVEINERNFPGWPVTYEKLQIHRIAKEIGSDWNIFVDGDALINPEMPDPTMLMRKDTVAHNGKDMANVRWRYDQYFRRDGRNFGSCNWFTVASDECLDLWRPLDDLTLDQALANINITVGEHNSGQCKRDHLIDDYTLSRNIARFGLKATTMLELMGPLGWRAPDGRNFNPYLWHIYTETEEQKLNRMLGVLATPNQQMIPHPQNPQVVMDQGWGLIDPAEANKCRKLWNLP